MVPLYTTLVPAEGPMLYAQSSLEGWGLSALRTARCRQARNSHRGEYFTFCIRSKYIRGVTRSASFETDKSATQPLINGHHLDTLRQVDSLQMRDHGSTSCPEMCR